MNGQDKPQQKFICAFTLCPREAWEKYQDSLFKPHSEDIPDHLNDALYLAFLVGLSHGATLQGSLTRNFTEFVNERIDEMFKTHQGNE